MTKGSNFWVIGGEFGSMNFHKLVEGSAQVKGPFKTRKEAEECLARGVGRKPAQGRRALLDRGRAAPRDGLIAAIFERQEAPEEHAAAPSGYPGGAARLFIRTSAERSDVRRASCKLWEQTAFAETWLLIG